MLSTASQPVFSEEDHARGGSYSDFEDEGIVWFRKRILLTR
jgi:hypothetical protein